MIGVSAYCWEREGVRRLMRALSAFGQYVAIATHDLSLSRLLADRFQTWHLAVDTSGDDVDFLFRLEAGPATTRTALALLACLGAPARVVDAASLRACALELNDGREMTL